MIAKKHATFLLKSCRDKMTGAFNNNYVVSYPRAGRTWLRNILNDYGKIDPNSNIAALKEKSFDFDTFATEMSPKYTKIIFGHDVADYPYINYMNANNIPSLFNPQKYRNKNLALITRHPIDIAVSHFHWLKSIADRKNKPYHFPSDIDSFVLSERYGAESVASYYDHWIKFIKDDKNKCNDTLILSYEGFRADTTGHLMSLLNFFKIPFDKNTLNNVVENHSIQNIKNNKTTSNQAVAKLKSGVIHGYKTKLKPETIEKVERLISKYRYEES